MKRILIVKVTSLGDIVETLPVVSDLRRAFPSAKVDWAADAAFADIIRWNPGVDRVLSAPLRKFKKARNWNDLKDIGASIGELRAEKYDVIVDIHGVYKSAIIAFIARGKRRFGYLNQDLGERGAAFAYNARFGPRPHTDAWRGMRVSVADALGYQLDETPDYNVQLPAPTRSLDIPSGKPIAMLFHATSADVKKWPKEHWGEVGRWLVARGYVIALPWGTERERDEAQTIAALVPDAIVLPKLTVEECAHWIEASELVVGTDTGLVHLAHALQRRTVMLFAATSREHFGVSAPGRSVSVGDHGAPPDVPQVLEAIESVMGTPARTVSGSAQSGAMVR
ncbi:lipopolysaccharide heptosyltransferase I [Caballeronia insecticola]|uniref:Lipopolysaccharide heptosyltransferase 1 n=1 Tax=Caballeronia insecticola TaxID=758793 RepID=R4X0J2_9BURK|nr:lipopolysaccharide heptosyltransferase I [Caballeronia insecticola]BAN25551.1 lipopolysaccharide heptosyltransferase-1 [Caballeronia insecticola]